MMKTARPTSLEPGQQVKLYLQPFPGTATVLDSPKPGYWRLMWPDGTVTTNHINRIRIVEPLKVDAK